MVSVFTYSISWKPLRFASWFPTLISCSPNLLRVYIRLCKHRNHFTFLHYKMLLPTYFLYDRYFCAPTLFFFKAISSKKETKGKV